MDLTTIRNLAARIYGASNADLICHELSKRIAQYEFPSYRDNYSQKDIILITYGDMVTRKEEKPLSTLLHFLKKHVSSVINTIHILPFFPYSSDEGFSIIDYKSVNDALGTWDDVERISEEFFLMVDLVANHTSIESDWFQNFLKDEKKYNCFYITIPPDSDTRKVFRPRTSPLLTLFETENGKKYVWTTFSADQADLNYQQPEVLIEMIDVLLFYVSQSAKYIRLDAIAYIWKELGTSCIHQPQVHLIIQLMRLILDQVSPGVKLITETNVPHEDNISYFGNGKNEAQLVYNFSLPPLTLHAFHTGNGEIFTKWAETLKTPSNKTAFFNFLASHDGIGVTPANGILPPAEILEMARQVEAAGGYVSYKTNTDGSKSAYEFNINFYDALENDHNPNLPIALRVRRFVTAHAVMVALQGIPGIYFHSLFGSTSWFEGAEKSGAPRSINRERLNYFTLESALRDKTSLRYRIFTAIAHLLSIRSALPAFHPSAPQKVLSVHPAVITILRQDPDSGKEVLCFHNLRPEGVEINLPDSINRNPTVHSLKIHYQNSSNKHLFNHGTVKLAPFEALWVE